MASGTDAQLLPGIGGYRVERALGQGGMGLVYLCRDEQLDRPVAIKVLRPELLEQSDMRQRFLREARALARVSSPFVVSVFAVGEDAVSGPFVVMELLEGEDLLQKMRREGRVAWREACRLARDACAGLMAAADAGLVHRDVKPANLFVLQGRAKLTDFGLAREVQGSASMTQAGLVVGTPAYLAPELVKGASATHISDLYSLGATLFHAIAGEPPFPGEAPLEVLTDAMSKPAPLLSARAHETPPALVELVDAMLRKDPAQRPQSLAEVSGALQALIDGTATAALPAPSANTTQLFGTLAPAASPVPQVSSPAMPAQQSAPQSVPPTVTATPVSASLATAVAEPSFPTGVPTQGHGESSAPAARIKSTSLAVMMTDIAGYTERTGRQSRDESARWLALHDALLQPVFKAFGGRVVKTLGDAFLVTFASPTDAVLCGCAIQDRLFGHNQTAKPEDHITVRVALSAGEVRLHKGDVFGEPVNLAARLEALAQPGEVLLSDAVYSTMNAAEVKLERRGEEQLKGIARAVTVYRAVPDGIAGAPPYGGRALSRVKDSALSALRARAPEAIAALKRTREMMLVNPWVQRTSQRQMVAAIVGLVLVAVLFGVLTRDSRRDKIRDGKAKDVLAELDKIPDDKRTGEDWLDIGFAQIALDNRDRGFAAFKQGAKAGATLDDEVLEQAIAALDERDDDGAKEMLVHWPDGRADDAARALLEGDAWWPRDHALDILEARKKATDEDRQAVGLKDLEADDCMQRRTGLFLLKKYGRGDDVLAAVKKAGSDMPRNLCMALDAGAAEATIKKRNEEKPK